MNLSVRLRQLLRRHGDGDTGRTMSASWRTDRDYFAAAILAGMGTLGLPHG